MGKLTSKQGKGITALTSKKSSWKQVDASPGKTTSRTQGVAISKKSLVTHSQSLSTCNTVPKTKITQSSSVKDVATTSKVGSNDGAGEAPAAGQRSYSRKVLKSKFVGCKSLGSTLRFPPPISKKVGADQVNITAGHIIWKPAWFLQQDTLTLVHLLDSSGPGDHGQAAQKLVWQKQVWVRSLSPEELDGSNPDPAASDVFLGHHLDETNQSQPTPCNSHDSSPVPAGQGTPDDNLVELEASQDELDELDKDESTDVSLETSQDSQILKCQLHDKHKWVKKAEKQAQIQQLHSVLAETDHQLDLLKQKSLAQSTINKGSRQPAATSTPQNFGQADQSWLQEADLDAADAFLNQLDDTSANEAGDSQHSADKPGKATKKRKPAQPWFMLPE